ncbi:hypothetical protein FRC11_010467, partial [Ceratobasidium sp. 423]
YKSQSLNLARNVMELMLDIEKVTSGAPAFYYKGSQPDYFLAHLKDATGYTKPAPNWTWSFTNNYPWFTTYTDHFKKSVIDDQSAFSAAASEYNDLQMLMLLHDGPFRSLVSAWKREHPGSKKGGKKGARKGDEEAEVDKDEEDMDEKAKKRGAKHLEAKTFARQEYHSNPRLKAMVGSKWSAAWSKPAMLPTITDDEGGLVVQAYDWRAGWFTNLQRTFDNAERAKELAKPSLHRPPVECRVEVVDGNPPTIFMGKGKDKKLLMIPATMISKQWKQVPANAAWMNASTHLIDSTLDCKPDISAFLAAHPAPTEPNHYEGEDEKEGKSEEEGDDKGEGEGKGKGEGEGEEEDAGKGKGEEEDVGEGGYGGEDEETFGAELAGLGAEGPEYGAQGLVLGRGLRPVGRGGGRGEDPYIPGSAPATFLVSCPLAPVPSDESERTQPGGNIVINPQFLQSLARAHPHVTNDLDGTTQATYPPNDAPHAEPKPHYEPPLPQSAWPNIAPPMPSPPTLSQQERAASTNAAPLAPEPTTKKATKGAQKPCTKKTPVEENLPGPSSSTVPQVVDPSETTNPPKH